MDKKTGSKSNKFEKPKANIIKRNIENAKKTRNKSKENIREKPKVQGRPHSENAKIKKLTEVANTASDTFDSIKSPIPPNKISPVKVKQSSAPTASKAENTRTSITTNEKRDRSSTQESNEINAELINTGKEDMNEIVKPVDTDKPDSLNVSPAKQGITMTKASSLKRKREFDDDCDSMEKSIKNSI